MNDPATVRDLSEAALAQAAELTRSVVDEVQAVYVGPREVPELLLISLLARGHALLERKRP